MQTRKVHIHQDEIWTLVRFNVVQAIKAIANRVRLIAMQTQESSQHFSFVGNVFDQQCCRFKGIKRRSRFDFDLFVATGHQIV